MFNAYPLYILFIGVKVTLIYSYGTAIYDTLILNSFASFLIMDEESILWHEFNYSFFIDTISVSSSKLDSSSVATWMINSWSL